MVIPEGKIAKKTACWRYDSLIRIRFAALLYVVGLSRIGASLTSTIASSNILFTLLFQLLFRGFGIRTNVPENILLAVIGGALGVFGIYLIHVENNPLFRKV